VLDPAVFPLQERRQRPAIWSATLRALAIQVYEAIENGLAEMDDSNLKGRIIELKRIRDAARADADRAENRGEGDDNRVTPELLRRFGLEARKKIRDQDGGFRRHHLQALVQRVEVGTDEIRIRGYPVPRAQATL
jgi:hypothetical protein